MMVPPDNELLFSAEPSNHEKTRENLKCSSLSEKSPSEKATHCMIPTIGYSEKRQNYGYSEKNKVCQGLGRRRNK